jgi:hypothetical protein
MDKQLSEAIALLRDANLLWSEDFETIRLPLADLLERHRLSSSHFFDDDLYDILGALQGDAVPGSIDYLGRWADQAKRDLRLIQDATGRSKYLADALTRLFDVL